MITDWLLDVAVNIVTWFLGLIPPLDLDPSLTSGEAFQVLADLVEGFGVWVSWPVLVVCVGAVAGTWVIGVGAKGIRALIAHVPQVGGSGD